MNDETQCATIRPWLFASLEETLNDREREAVDRHLEQCDACRQERERERWLTQELTATQVLPQRETVERRGPRRRTPWLRAAAAVIFLGGIGTVMILDESPAYGSIAPATLGPSMRWSNGEVQPLASHNHLRVPAHETNAVTIDGVATLDVRGPAVFDLDFAVDEWKLVLLQGAVRAMVETGATLWVSSVNGLRQLTEGEHLVTLVSGVESNQDDTPAALIDQGHAYFFQQEDMTKAEAAFRAAWTHPDATDAERNSALFYLGAAVSRQGRTQDAYDLGETWLEANPEDDSVAYVLFFQAGYLRELGREEEARATFERVIEMDPDADIAGHARTYLNLPAGGGSPAPATPQDAGYEPRRLLPFDPEQTGAQMVVTVGLRSIEAHEGFADVAAEASAGNGVTRLDLPTFDEETLSTSVRELRPEFVLFVLPPEELDVQLHRRVMLLSSKIDEDIFPDFSWGWMTARDGDSVRRLWKRTCETAEEGLSSEEWATTFVTSGMKSRVYPGRQLPIAAAAGYEENGYAFAESSSDPEVLAFVDQTLPKLESAGVIRMTGNGDPQGIWVFDGNRNMDPSLHWPYSADKVGHDPDHEMPRIESDRFSSLSLHRPIVWSGTCHSAATHRVFVEGDIVSTFGKTDEVTVYEMPLEESLGLSILEGGAVALLAPIGANHGYSVDLESEFALRHGASLGETIKSTWDDVHLQARGQLTLHLPAPGDPQTWHAEHIMWGGGVNRALLGDPRLRPFRKTDHPTESATVQRTGDHSFDVTVEWKQGNHIPSWNLYHARFGASLRRVLARVDIGEVVPEGSVHLSAQLHATDAQGQPLDLTLTHAEPEFHHGKRWLHVQAEGAQELFSGEIRAVFSVVWQ